MGVASHRLEKQHQHSSHYGQQEWHPRAQGAGHRRPLKSSGMDAAQVKEHFAAFLESHPNGKMKPKEFREMVEKTMPKSDAGKMEKHVFRIYDSNNDGYIDFVEFMLIFHIMSDGTPEEVLEKIFRVFDVNSDGTINKKEMQRLIKDMYGLIKADDPEAESKDLVAKS